MPEMEPVEDERGDPIVHGEGAASHARSEQSARSFFAVLCFFIAFIFLINFVNNPPGNITGLLVLFGIFAFGLGGMYLLSPGKARPHGPASSLNRAQPESGWHSPDAATSVESTLTYVEDPPAAQAMAGSEPGSFDRLVAEVLVSIPAEFQERLANLVVLVQSEADEEVLRRVGIQEGYTLLGLYQGVPLTTYGHGHTMLPERIIIYQCAIEAFCQSDPERIREQVRRTVLHEVAHHFGMNHAEMPIWIK